MKNIALQINIRSFGDTYITIYSYIMVYIVRITMKERRKEGKMESVANRDNDVDTYQKMRSAHPIKYGEYLCELHERGLSQKDIAESLKTNRQLVGRYQRIGRWDGEIKTFLEGNRQFISNTAILNAAMSPKSKDELLEEFKKLVGNTSGPRTVDTHMGKLKQFPTLPAFSEISARLSSLEQRFESLAATSELSVKSKKERLPWVDLFFQLTRPESMFLLICITGLSSYLIHQGLLFFSAIDHDSASSLSSAIVSETIPLLSAACLALSTQRSRKIIAMIILGATIAGLGFFMHTSLADRMTKQSGYFTRLNTDREIILSTVEALRASMASLPETYITKRQSLASQISNEQAKLSEVNAFLGKVEVQRANINIVSLFYSVWLRIAAMILNAFLVHLFFVGIAKVHGCASLQRDNVLVSCFR